MGNNVSNINSNAGGIANAISSAEKERRLTAVFGFVLTCASCGLIYISYKATISAASGGGEFLSDRSVVQAKDIRDS